ncbi:hypothetical protein [Rhodanobacter soli]|uniref:hypothetical protein n=1 Tax=Rhodanobacter soli TaxID=590609 RepID=UPI0031DD5202
MFRATTLAVLCCLGIAAAHAQQTSPTAPASGDAQLSTVLDPARPTAERLREFSALMQEANAGDAIAQDIAGSWYWRGHAQPGVVVEQDLTQARALLSHAAIQGRLGAMAKMAELELEAGRTFEAMLWAQVYGHYQPLETKRAHEKAREDEDYTGFLLSRIYAKFDRKRVAEVGTVLNAFLAKYDATIRAGVEHSSDVAEHGNLHELKAKDHQLHSVPLTEPGVAEFFIVYGPDGQPVQVLPIVAYPDSSHHLAAKLVAIAQRIRVNSIKAPDLRYAVIPVTYITGKYRVNKT